MHIHDILVLVSLVVAPASGVKDGVSRAPSPHVGALVGRRGLGVAEVPKPGVLREHLPSLGFLSHGSNFSPLFRRSRDGSTHSGSAGVDAHSMSTDTQSPGPSGGSTTSNISDAQSQVSTLSKQESPSSSDMQWEASTSTPGTRRPIPFSRHAQEASTSASTSTSTSRKRKAPSSPETRPGPENHPNYHVPLDPTRHNVPGQDRNVAMHLAITPDPRRFKGLLDRKTGQRSYFRSIGGGREPTDASKSRAEQFGAVNPSFLVATSENQRGHLHHDLTPWQYEEFHTTASREARHADEPLWFKITPRKFLPFRMGLNPWTDAELGQSLVEQHRNFPNHDAGQENSKYAGLDEEMRYKCDVKPCKAKKDVSQGVVVDEPHLGSSKEEEPLSPKTRRLFFGRFVH